MMTDNEAIAAVKAGQRACTESSIRTDRDPEFWKCQHKWRTIACNSDQDVIECSDCGDQRISVCDFDDEFD